MSSTTAGTVDVWVRKRTYQGGKRPPLTETDICKQGDFALKPYEDARIPVIDTWPGKKESSVRKVGKS